MVKINHYKTVYEILDEAYDQLLGVLNEEELDERSEDLIGEISEDVRLLMWKLSRGGS